MDADVIIVGAGPVGLMLAGELRLGGASVVVVERMAERGRESRGVGFTARATEVFHQRGLLSRFEKAETSTRGHFGGIPMDYGVLEDSHFGVRGIPQYRIEEMLEGWARELGADLRRGHELTGLRQTASGVVAVVDGGTEITGSYLVGCDGGRSAVRRLAGFDFPGTEAVRQMYLADVTGCEIRPRLIGERNPRGVVLSGPLEKDVDRIIVCEVGARPTENRTPSFTEIADAWERITGESIHGGEPLWVSGFTDATRQAAQYRRGRVLLAGDAAHIHLPAGGQGLSVGVQDAANLGWKLAATVRGHAPEGLLDSYHDERHPVGARVLRNTQAQGILNLSGSQTDPLRTVMAELMALPVVARHLSGMVSGLDIRYDVGASGHPLLGARMPDRPLELPDGRRTSVAEVLHPARGVLITTAEQPEAARWPDRVDVVTVTDVPVAETTAVLVRPDGHVVWAAPSDGSLAEALRRWFGAPTEGVQHVRHEITVDAPAAQVYDLIADVEKWPEIFPPTVHAECVERDGDRELIQIWATANGTARTWTSRREHHASRLSIGFRQQRSAPPVGGMGGEWVVEPTTESRCHVVLLHDYFAATDDPADLAFIGQAVDRNSTSELNALKTGAELGPVLTFDDTVEIDGGAEAVYGFLNDAGLWKERLPHVSRVALEEETPGLQILEMDTRAKDGSVHTTRSVRVCRPYSAIIYKQIVLPPLLTLHTGRWLIEPRPGGGVSVTSRHTVRIDPARIEQVLGAGADLAKAQAAVRASLSANSLATLGLAKAYAERAEQAAAS